MLQPKVLRTNDSSIYFYDSSNAILNNNQVLYNNPTTVVETNSSEKKKKMLRNNKKAVQITAKVKFYRYLKISIPRKTLVNQILVFQVVLILPKNSCSTNHNLLQPMI